MRFQLTYHARQRMRERGISADEIREVLRQGKQPRASDDYEGCVCMEGTFGARTITVVVNPIEEVVVTAWHD